MGRPAFVGCTRGAIRRARDNAELRPGRFAFAGQRDLS